MFVDLKFILFRASISETHRKCLHLETLLIRIFKWLTETNLLLSGITTDVFSNFFLSFVAICIVPCMQILFDFLLLNHDQEFCSIAAVPISISNLIDFSKRASPSEKKNLARLCHFFQVHYTTCNCMFKSKSVVSAN